MLGPIQQTDPHSVSVADAVDRIEDVVAALTRLTSRAGMRRALLAEGSDLSPTDTWLLRRLVTHGPARMSELAQWQLVDRSTVTVQIRRLEEAGLVTRAPDPADRRALQVSVTELGRETFRRNSMVARMLFGEILSQWSDERRLALVESLEHFVDDVGRYLDLPTTGAKR